MAARAALVALTLAAAAAGAQAQLFPDNEARRAIVELRAENEAQKKLLAEQNRDLAEQISQLKRSLLELNNQIEALRGDLARQRGSNEQLARDLAEVQRRQKDVAQAVEERVSRLEPQKVTFDGKDFMADAEEKRSYDEAFALVRSGDFTGAVGGLSVFLRRYPQSGYADAARYWLGNAHYGKKELREAIAAFRGFIAMSPEHPRVPEAMLAIANSQAESKDVRGARFTLAELVKLHPTSEAAQAARERLAVLK
jgi:tol-pal system protein YbgF